MICWQHFYIWRQNDRINICTLRAVSQGTQLNVCTSLESASAYPRVHFGVATLLLDLATPRPPLRIAQDSHLIAGI